MADFIIMLEKKKALTPVFIGGYVNYFEPKAYDAGDKPAWGMQLMFPKDGPGVTEFMAELKKIYVQVLVDKHGKDKAVEIAKNISAKKRFPVRDGDVAGDTAGLANSDQLRGHLFMNANNIHRQPSFIGPAGKAIPAEQLSADDVYSGAHYRAMLEFWYYKVKGNEGISCSLASFMKVKDDVSLGGGTTVAESEDAFADFAGDAIGASDMGVEIDTGGSPAETEDAGGDFDFLK